MTGERQWALDGNPENRPPRGLRGDLRLGRSIGVSTNVLAENRPAAGRTASARNATDRSVGDGRLGGRASQSGSVFDPAAEY